MFRRLKEFIRMILSLMFDTAEDSVPVERRLAYRRQEVAKTARRNMEKATDVAAVAEMMVRQLAEARIVAANLRQEALTHVQAANKAAARGETKTAENEEASAAALADDMAEAEQQVNDLKQTVAESLKDKQDAKEMVLKQALDLERMARKDNRTVAKIRISEMRDDMLNLKMAMEDLIPEQQDNVQQRAVTQAQRMEDRVKAKSEIVEALWQQKRRGLVDQRTQVSARGAQLLAEIEAEVGYTPTSANPASVEETDAAAKAAQ